MEASQPLTGGRLNSALANAVVRLHSRYVGRGPTKAQAFHRHNVVVLLLEGGLTQAEQALVVQNEALALTVRRQVHEMMRDDLMQAVEALTGDRVLAFLYSSHIEPDLIGHVFILDSAVADDEASLEVV